jgi:broad specificity phosphatase PhoE
MKGLNDTLDVMDRLYAVRFGHSMGDPIILTSKLQRSMETSQYILRTLRRQLPGVSRVKSDYVAKLGMRPQPVEEVYGFVGQLLTACHVDHEESDVLMISHQPLVRAVAGTRDTEGHVYAVQPDWTNPLYNPDLAYVIDEPERW